MHGIEFLLVNPGLTYLARDAAWVNREYDALPAGATPLYYRLRQIDQDGTAAYSPMRTVDLVKA